MRFFLFGSDSIGTSALISVELCRRSDALPEVGRKPNISVMEKRRVGVVAELSSVESIELVRTRVLILGGFQRTSGSMSGLCEMSSLFRVVVMSIGNYGGVMSESEFRVIGPWKLLNVGERERWDHLLFLIVLIEKAQRMEQNTFQRVCAGSSNVV
jgi:hypothetical protein